MTATTTHATEPIPGYVLKARLGAGGYGEVWQAEAPGGLLKAIKFVYGYHDEDRAARELKALNRIKQVRHPFLLSLERIEIIDGQLLIVTELADASLKDVFTNRRGEGLPGIPRDELLQHMRDTADALDYMNEQFSLQHLDIKPENLLLVGGRIKVGDFGLVKDIHDNTMSLMGGLTPIYAPPEVFDGRPSRRSDQYSLAIVYQQMLTGELPFSGRTAAQLASQHLHAKPRFMGLSPEDQAVLERALAKDPSERFVNCREMVDRLTGRPAGGWSRAGEGADHADPTNAPGRSFTGPRKTLGRTEVMEAEEAEANSLSSVSRSVSRRETFQPTPSALEGDTYVPKAAAKPKVVALPPFENVEFQARLRPTVFVGVGGTAAAVLRGLRTQIADRLGGVAETPAFRMVLIDSDVQTLKDAEYADAAASFGAGETLATPLRRPQDYRNRSADHLKWLSRRWLYNIPRSLKTEGLRPLGRLALADHSALVLQRLEDAIAAATSPESLLATANRVGVEMASARPRIVVVASISGGTGGGAALDVAYLARQALVNLGLESDEIDAVLTHSTPRSAQGRELALANAFAFLREWRHYHRRGYPGDRSCGLPPFDATPPFQSSYLVHLGNDLGEDEFRSTAESVGQYLFLDSFTSAGDFFLRCRPTEAESGSSSEPMLRTFGVCPIGAAGRDQVANLVETLCRGVLDRWRGLSEQSRAARLVGAASAAHREDSCETPVDAAAVERAGGLRLDLDEWLRRVQQIVEAILQSEPDVFFDGLLNDALPHVNVADAELPALGAEALRTINGVLGHREAEMEFRESSELNVIATLEERIDLLAGRQAAAIQRCVWERLDAPKRMVKSAQYALQEYLELLRAVDQKARTARQEMEQDLTAGQQRIREFHAPESRKGATRGAGQPAPHQVLREMLQDYARRRLASVYLQAVCRLAQTVIRRLTLAGDDLKELARGLDKAAGQFSLGFDDGLAGASTVVVALRSRTAELISLLDEQFRHSFFPAGEGFRAALRKELQLMDRLAGALRETARRIASEAMRSMDLAGVLFPEGEDPLKTHERMAGIVQAAQPRLIHCGGATRALLVLPESARDGRLPALFAARFGQPPTTVFDMHSDAALCCEMEQLPVASLAATLIDHRRDLAEAAVRLHARSDVNWSPWPRVSDAPSP